MNGRRLATDRAMRWAGDYFQSRNRTLYLCLILFGLLVPSLADVLTGGQGNTFVDIAGDAGVFVLLAIGLNVVVGFAGLLDLGYAAFFAIGAYSYGMLASGQLAASPLHHAYHITFWLLLFVGLFVAAAFGIILGAPTLRLRGDYLAIVTLGFGEIVPLTFRFLGPGSPLGNWTGGVNNIVGIDPPQLPFFITGPWVGTPIQVVQHYIFIDPMAFYLLVLVLIAICAFLATNLINSRLGRAWMAVREDEVAAAATGINTVAIKLTAFAIGASFSGFAGAYYGAKLLTVSPDNFTFLISVTILIMVVLGGMGNIPGVIVGSILISFVNFVVLTYLPDWSVAIANAVGLGSLANPSANGGWVGLHDEVQRLNYLVFGLILVGVMLLRPQGLFPSRIREEELEKGTQEEAVFDMREVEGSG